MDNFIRYKNFNEKVFQLRNKKAFEFLPKLTEVAQRNGDRLYYLYTDSIKCALLKIVNGETDTRVLTKYLKLAMQGMYGHVKSLINFGKPVELFIGNKKVNLVNESREYSRLSNLTNILLFARICRFASLEDLIFEVTEKSVFFDHPNQEPFLAGYSINKMVYSNELEESEFDLYFNKLIKKHSSADSEEFKVSIVIPYRAAEKELLFGSSKSFSEKLSFAINSDRSYWESKEDNRYVDIDKMLPWFLISLACRAYDKGWDITVEDPRLPLFLVKGECNIDSLEFTDEEWRVG